MIRAFNVSHISDKPYNYTNDGILLGWGLRNSVGVSEDRLGGLWSVENSDDFARRDESDIHTNNPADELNWHGSLSQTVGVPGYAGPNYGTAPFPSNTFVPSPNHVHRLPHLPHRLGAHPPTL